MKLTGDQKCGYYMGEYFGISMAFIGFVITLLSRISSTGLSGILYPLVLVLLVSIVGGVLSGFLFGYFMYKIYSSKWMQKQTAISLEEGESIIYQEMAALRYKKKSTCGKLYLLNDKLVFRSDKWGFCKKPLYISLSDIDYLYAKNSWVGTPNGLSIKTYGGEEYEFFVGYHRLWLEHIVAAGHFRKEETGA